MSSESYSLKKLKVWQFGGENGWYMITLPPEIAAEIEERFEHIKKDFGIIKVEATIGETNWQTSIFKDTKTDSFVLPIKADIRRKTGVTHNDLIDLRLRITD